jgi:hypothetical protein
MAHLGSLVLYGNRILHHSYSIRKFPFFMVDEMCTVDFGALGGRLDIGGN